MEQIKALWRDTWWLWILFVGIAIGFSAVASLFFIVILLALPFVYIYFAYIRYDENGEELRR